jgi:hypothetical protein
MNRKEQVVRPADPLPPTQNGVNCPSYCNTGINILATLIVIEDGIVGKVRRMEMLLYKEIFILL